MTDTGEIHTTAAVWAVPSKSVGALAGIVVVLGFTIVHNIYISDIWFNFVPMLFAGAVCGLCIVWSYSRGVAEHSTAAWFGYCGMYGVEMIVLGGVSLLVLRPQFTMAELMVADDAFERLLPPSMPLLIGSMVLGTILIWVYFGRRRAALIPILVTQVLLVFLLGHQFAFLGLVESSSALLVIFGEFAAITVALAAVFGLGVMSSTIGSERVRTRS